MRRIVHERSLFALRYLVPLFFCFLSICGLAVASDKAGHEFQGTIDATRYDRSLNQLHIEGWGWDSVTRRAPEKLQVFIHGRHYEVEILSLSERKDVQAVLGVPGAMTGFSTDIPLQGSLPSGTHLVEVSAIFDQGRAIKLPAWGGETPRVQVDKPQSRHWILLALVLAAIALSYAPPLRRWGKGLEHWVGRHPQRTGIAIGTVFVLLVAFGITGSSLQLLRKGPQGPFGLGVMEFNGSDARLFKLRDIRSDEWGVLAANTLAQWNHSPRFPIVNSNIGIEGQNMGVVGMTGVPISQPAALARPATWGYFLLPLRQALSWHWQFPIFACLFFLWQALNLLRPGNYGFNLALSTAFCTAPYAAGWSHWPLYAALFPLALFVTTASALRNKSLAKALVLGAVTGVLGAGWVLVLYPPWQITVGTFFVLLAIGWLLDHRQELQFRKAQWLSFSVALLVVATLLGSWWIDTADAVEKIRSTAYPGARKALQGGEISWLWALRGYTNPETLTFGAGPHSNQSEIGSYLLFPLPLLVLALIYCRRSINARWALFACLVFAAAWTVFRFLGIPLWLAEATFWSRVPSGRLDLAIGLACTALLAILTPNARPDSPTVRVSGIRTCMDFAIACGSALLVFIGLQFFPKELFANNSPPFLWSLVLAGFFVSWWMMRGKVRTAVCMILILNVISTIAFNPVSRAPRSVNLSSGAMPMAIDPPTSKPLRTLVIGGWGVGPMTFAAVGVPTINGVLYYPQRSFWEGLGLPAAEWNTVNRYQHLGIELGALPDERTFEVRTNQLDSVDIKIDPQRFDFTQTGAQRLAALEPDAKLLRGSPYLKEQGQYGGVFWFAIRTR